MTNTNFNQATKSFTLHAVGTQSYAWAWENLDRAQCLSEIEEAGNDIVAYADGWACELCNACIDQITESERGFTVEEITNDLIADRYALADALQAWLEGEYEDPEGDDQDDEPQLMYIISWGELSQGKFRMCCSRIEAEKELYFRAFTSMRDSDAEWVMTTHFEYRDLPNEWEWVGDRYEITDQKTCDSIALTKRPLPIGKSSTTWIYQIDEVTLVAHLIEGLDYESPGLGNGRTIIPPYKPTN